MSITKMGTYEFLSPFDKVTKNVKLKKVSSRSIKEILDAGIDIFKLVYQKVGLDKKIYEDDVVKDIQIYIFLDDSGNYFYVPMRYVKDVSNVDKIKYTNKLLGINLGPIPADQDLSNLLDLINELVIKELGVRPSIKVADICQTTYIDKETHEQLENKKAILKEASISPFLNRLELESIIRKQDDQINKLKCAIKYMHNNWNAGDDNIDDFLD